MKLRRIFRITLSFLTINLLFFLGLLIFPSWLYGYETDLGQVQVYHQKPLPGGFEEVVKESLAIIKKSELYTPAFYSELCLNDGSLYPKLVKATLGDDVFRAFAQKAVMLGEFSADSRSIQAWGRELSTVQFLSHAFVHNLQYEYHGVLGANPLGRHPEWKWEGYAEYIVLGRGQSLDYYLDLLKRESGPFDWLDLDGGLSTIRMHLEFMVLAKYCFEQKGWSYKELMKDNTSREQLTREMEQWYKGFREGVGMLSHGH
ncbi:MAG: hypothetical protein Roseis2KO_45730 [Roseivirga sp.]